MDRSPIEKNKNKKVDNWEIWQYCHNFTARNPNCASCEGNSTKLIQFAHHLVFHFSLVLSFPFFFLNREDIQIWSLRSRNCLVGTTCNLRATRIYKQSIFWFIGTMLSSVKRKWLSCRPRSYQYARLLPASAHWGPGVRSSTYLGAGRPLLRISVGTKETKTNAEVQVTALLNDVRTVLSSL